MDNADGKFMLKALQLAARGGRAVAPNPMVGAVIVKNGHIIGKGYHQKFGGPHAEVMAINAVKQKSDLQGATLYVTLEPCHHHGKTPPCLDLIRSLGLKKVVIGSKDPFQKGRPPKDMHYIFLKGSIAQACKSLNRFYFTWITKKRPFITVKVALSADGFVTTKDRQPVHFTSKIQDKYVHQLRAQHQAIMVGAGTVLSDDPHLGVRHNKGEDPLRIILDAQKHIPLSAQVFRDKNHLHITQNMPLKSIMRQLAEKGIASVLVEPGPTLYTSLKKQNLIDELIVLKGKKKLKTGIKIEL